MNYPTLYTVVLSLFGKWTYPKRKEFASRSRSLFRRVLVCRKVKRNHKFRPLKVVSLFLKWESEFLSVKRCLLCKTVYRSPCVALKGSIEIDIFIQERFNELIYGNNTIIKCGIWKPVKFHLISHLWSGYKMKPTLIQRYRQKSFHVWSSWLNEILQAFRCHILWLY